MCLADIGHAMGALDHLRPGGHVVEGGALGRAGPPGQLASAAEGASPFWACWARLASTVARSRTPSSSTPPLPVEIASVHSSAVPARVWVTAPGSPKKEPNRASRSSPIGPMPNVLALGPAFLP